MQRERCYTRCSVTGARVTRDTYVCEIVDQFNPVKRADDGLPEMFSLPKGVYVCVALATCQYCTQFYGTKETNYVRDKGAPDSV